MSTTVLFSKGDLVLNEATRQPYMISGSDKGVQDVLFSFTAQDPYGAGFSARFGRVPRSGPDFAAELTQSAREAFERLQQRQRRFKPEAYTPDELVVSIDSVFAQQDPNNPTDYRFFVRVSLGRPVLEVEL
jgi:hypothetical protein